jgi:predicted restriction endonuclease
MYDSVDISPEWTKALENVASRRSKKHYKPAALLVVLDMIEDREALNGRVPYVAYHNRFEKLIAEVDPDASEKGWQPFLHLSTGDQIWDLYREGHPVDLEALLERRSRSTIENEVDEARIRPHLLPFISNPEGRQAIRDAIYRMLGNDEPAESAHLIEVARAGIGADAQLTMTAQTLADAGVFDPDNSSDARQRTLADIVRRQGQPAFRQALLDAYGRRCAITGCDVDPALEAAHITPYLGSHTNHVTNGILLRADIHTLFDLHLLTVNPDSLTVRITPDLRRGHYAALHGRTIAVPADPQVRPSIPAIKSHFEGCDIPD